MDNSLFYEIMNNCTEKKVVSRCKKLMKKSALTSGAAATTLAELAYWLYVYGYSDEALQVCAFSHIEEPKPEKVNYNVWDFILYVWGLEAYIYRRQGKDEKAAERIAAMERVWSTPTGVWNTAEAAIAQHKLIRGRLSFDDAVRREKIESLIAAGDRSMASSYCFTALYKMIGYGATGLFPKLEERKEELEKMINDYIQMLR